MSLYNNYWIIGGSSVDVYSNASNTMVSVDDSDYVAWAENNIASPIASEAELADTVRAYGSRLPAWLFNAPSFIQPAPGTYDKGQLAAYAADARYRHAGGGIVVTSLSAALFLTDPTSRNAVNSAYQYAVANPAHVSDWKMGDGTFIELDLAQLTTLNDDMTTFVQSCFTCESTTVASINGGAITDLAAIDAAFAAISYVFP